MANPVIVATIDALAIAVKERKEDVALDLAMTLAKNTLNDLSRIADALEKIAQGQPQVR